MSWSPITKIELCNLINDSLNRMTVSQKNLWESIKIDPEKWQEPYYGKEGGGFWAVAIIGKTVVWYNDIEEGFNRSKYDKPGTFPEYWCEQDDLEKTIQIILNEIKEGRTSAKKRGAPGPLE